MMSRLLARSSSHFLELPKGVKLHLEGRLRELKDWDGALGIVMESYQKEHLKEQTWGKG